jgi:predicted HAD superfamily Cof-like phosphohydrolase
MSRQLLKVGDLCLFDRKGYHADDLFYVTEVLKRTYHLERFFMGGRRHFDKVSHKDVKPAKFRSAKTMAEYTGKPFIRQYGCCNAAQNRLRRGRFQKP